MCAEAMFVAVSRPPPPPRITHYVSRSVPVLITGLEARRHGRGCCGRVRQSGSSKAVDQGNLEASQQLSTVFGVIYVVTYLDQYPAYMFAHQPCVQQRGGGGMHRPSILPPPFASLSLSLPSSSPPSLPLSVSSARPFPSVHEYTHSVLRV